MTKLKNAPKIPKTLRLSSQELEAIGLVFMALVVVAIMNSLTIGIQIQYAAVVVGVLTIVLAVMVLVVKNFKREPSEITILKQKVSQAYLDALEASSLNPQSFSKGHPKP